MSEQKNSFLYIGENGKADWGVPEGYPYKEELFNIEWDGNTEGLISIQNVAVGSAMYKVSDEMPTNEQIRNITMTMTTLDQSNSIEWTIDTLSQIIGRDYWQHATNNGLITEKGCLLAFDEGLFAVIREKNLKISNLTFPETGTYFLNSSTFSGYISKAESKNIQYISNEFLPESVGNGAYIINVTMDENENYIADKSYFEISKALANGLIPYCIFGSAIFYMMKSDGLLTTYGEALEHSFLNIDPSSLSITKITINNNYEVKLFNYGTITVTT